MTVQEYLNMPEYVKQIHRNNGDKAFIEFENNYLNKPKEDVQNFSKGNSGMPQNSVNNIVTDAASTYDLNGVKYHINDNGEVIPDKPTPLKDMLDSVTNKLFGEDSVIGNIADTVSNGADSLGNLINRIIEDPETYFDYFRNGKANEYNYKINQETNSANLQIAKETNATNKEVADQNLGFQRELQEYNKALQERVFEREDTSYQRTAQDMINAGLNPLSMQGTNGAGEIIAQSPLHNEYQAQQSSPMQSFQYQAGGLQTVLSTFASLAQSVESIFTGKRQRDLLQSQIDKQNLENMIIANDAGIKYNGKYGTGYWFNDITGMGSAKKRYDINHTEVNYLNDKREYNHKESAGIYDSDLREERILTAMEDWLNNGRLEHFMDSMTDSGQKLLKKIFSK